MGNASQAGQGALGGAATGATLGSAVPGLGTAGGAIIGGVLGGAMGYFGGDDPSQQDYLLPGYDARQQSLNQEIGRAGGVGAPRMFAAGVGQFQNAGMGGAFRGGQLNLVRQLSDQAMGQGPSLATGQFNQALGQGIAAQQAQANTGTGNQALAGRQAAQNIGGMTQNLAGQAAQARIQEQMNARAQLGGILGQGRAQEMQGSQFNAGQQNQRLLAEAGFRQGANQFNADAVLRNRAMQNQYGLGLREMELRNAQLQQGGSANYASGQQNQLGTQLLSGGGGMLAQGFAAGQFGGGGGQPNPMQLQLGQGPGPHFGGAPTQFGSGYNYQGGLGGPSTAPVNPAGSGITGAQTGFTLPRL